MKIVHKVISFCLIIGICLSFKPTNILASERYADVPVDSWYNECVDYCVQNGIMIGVNDELFEPDRTITRAEFITALHRLAGKPKVVQKNIFNDVPKQSYYTNAVLWGIENQIVLGTSETTFSPNWPITREDIACLTARYVQAIDADFLNDGIIAELTYVDIDEVSSYAKESVDIIRHEALIVGDHNGMFNPQNPATRAEAAMIFMRLQKKIVGRQSAVLKLYDYENGQVLRDYTLTNEETSKLRVLLDSYDESWEEFFVPEYMAEYELILDDVKYQFESLSADSKKPIRCVNVYGGMSSGMYNRDGKLLEQVYELLLSVVS